MTSGVTTQLEAIGDALQAAWRSDHRRQPSRSRRRSIRIVVAATCLAAVTGGAAIAAGVLKSPDDAQRGLVLGHELFAGSSPTCRSLTATSFRCTLSESPTGMTFYDRSGEQLLDRFLGMKMITVDAERRVDGACVSNSADGREWDCYLGLEAVERGLLNAQLLGSYRPDIPTG